MSLHKVLLILGQIALISIFSPVIFGLQVEPQYHATNRLNTSSKCSETLTEVAGQISYPGGSSANHRCFWVIRVENATGYNISVQEFASRHIVSFTGFNHANLSDQEHYVVNNMTSEVFLFKNSNLVIIALETDYINSPFGISYEARFTDNTNLVSTNSGDYFCDTTEFNEWVYPTGDLSTKTNILSTFIVTPPENTYHPRRMLDFGIGRDPTHGDMACDWAFYSYFYQEGNLDNSEPTWDLTISTCEHPYYSGLFSLEPMLFIFYTENFNRNYTFDFTFYSYYFLKDDGKNEPKPKTAKFISNRE
ncbi:unnamed protein product [Orchesella dallaii]|uniref:CUB domain-containing protein n=1 Tax=Orchesella dallaii TaxID=48710 RepID=A0ABP1R7F2_9HEXA